MAQGWGRDTWGSHGFGAEVISSSIEPTKKKEK